MNLSEDQKTTIVNAVREYALDKGFHHEGSERINGSQLAKFLGINISYMSYILSGKWNDIKAGENTIQLADHYFITMANKIGYKMTRSLWKHFDSDNFLEVANTIEEARAHKRFAIIDGETGSGKTYSAVEYQRQRPKGTFLVTCDGTMTAVDFAKALNRTVGGVQDRSLYMIVFSVSETIRQLVAEGIEPVIIIDEAENLKDNGYQAIKALCDRLLDKVGIVLIGANEYIHTIKVKASRRKACYPQIWSRFKGRVVKLYKLNESELKEVCATLGITDRAVVKYLLSITDNWRDLSDYAKDILAEHVDTQEPINLALAKRVIAR